MKADCSSPAAATPAHQQDGRDAGLEHSTGENGLRLERRLRDLNSGFSASLDMWTPGTPEPTPPLANTPRERPETAASPQADAGPPSRPRQSPKGKERGVVTKPWSPPSKRHHPGAVPAHLSARDAVGGVSRRSPGRGKPAERAGIGRFGGAAPLPHAAQAAPPATAADGAVSQSVKKLWDLSDAFSSRLQRHGGGEPPAERRRSIGSVEKRLKAYQEAAGAASRPAGGARKSLAVASGSSEDAVRQQLSFDGSGGARARDPEPATARGGAMYSLHMYHEGVQATAASVIDDASAQRRPSRSRSPTQVALDRLASPVANQQTWDSAGAQPAREQPPSLSLAAEPTAAAARPRPPALGPGLGLRPDGNVSSALSTPRTALGDLTGLENQPPGALSPESKRKGDLEAVGGGGAAVGGRQKSPRRRPPERLSRDLAASLTDRPAADGQALVLGMSNGSGPLAEAVLDYREPDSGAVHGAGLGREAASSGVGGRTQGLPERSPLSLQMALHDKERELRQLQAAHAQLLAHPGQGSSGVPSPGRLNLVREVEERTKEVRKENICS